MIKIGLSGSTGKMGRAIIDCISAFNNSCILTATFASNSSITLSDFCSKVDVIIDFSSPVLLESLLTYSTTNNNKLVIGTTGFTARHFNLLKEASLQIPILYDANMSLGAHVAGLLAQKCAGILDDSYDINICDIHHRLKKDKPSGTALMYGKLISEVRNISEESCFSSIRVGDITGEHEIIFAGADEVITITHKALSRKIFANGAIKAALWLADKKPNLYSILDLTAINRNQL